MQYIHPAGTVYRVYTPSRDSIYSIYTQPGQYIEYTHPAGTVYTVYTPSQDSIYRIYTQPGRIKQIFETRR